MNYFVNFRKLLEINLWIIMNRQNLSGNPGLLSIESLTIFVLFQNGTRLKKKKITPKELYYVQGVSWDLVPWSDREIKVKCEIFYSTYRLQGKGSHSKENTGWMDFVVDEPLVEARHRRSLNIN